MWSNFHSEIKHGYHRETSTYEIGFVERCHLGYIASGQHADADAHIPRSEISRGCRTALVIGSKVDEQCVIGGKHDAKSHTQQERDAKKDYQTKLGTIPIYIYTSRKQKKLNTTK